MNTKELSEQVRVKVVEKYRSGLGYKKYQKLRTPHEEPFSPLLKKWKEYGTTTNTQTRQGGH